MNIWTFLRVSFTIFSLACSTSGAISYATGAYFYHYYDWDSAMYIQGMYGVGTLFGLFFNPIAHFVALNAVILIPANIKQLIF